ncbi:hypothetical protein Rhow_008538 [Rhodococcus wratislaviensis]|uniref:Uncharacterized protein n=1 Tax=Rhodococcus wratislaviensis TaxID=44752 RepID=A0A402CKR6_RHOWR|nr:hypothetical protein Rhow_008538 [Rhodococcus wratislaviensis]
MKQNRTQQRFPEHYNCATAHRSTSTVAPHGHARQTSRREGRHVAVHLAQPPWPLGDVRTRPAPTSRPACCHHTARPLVAAHLAAGIWTPDTTRAQIS